MKTTGSPLPSYILGHTPEELQRLALQAAFYRPLTDTLFTDAGLEPGMHVLDVGCGVGDVSFLAAERVGPAGSVVGIDRSGEALALARARAAEHGLANVRFVESSVYDFTSAQPFDAVVGRMILEHLPDPQAALRRAVELVRPGGLVVFQEMEMAARGMAWPAVPIFERIWDWVGETARRGGMRMNMGLELVPAMREAGLVQPRANIGGRADGGPDSPIYELATGSVRSMLPLMERLGIATATEVDVDTLAQRFRDQATACNATVVLSIFVGAWARKPG